MRYKVVAKVVATVTVFVDAVDREAALEAACNQWVYDDVDITQGDLFDPEIAEASEIDHAEYYAAPEVWPQGIADATPSA